MTLAEVVDAVEDAATVDLRGDKMLPWALKVDRARRPTRSCATRSAMLRAWRRAGAHRVDRDSDGHYEYTDAVRIIDAWWPLWLRASSSRALGKNAVTGCCATTQLDNAPNNHGDHLGSAYQGALVRLRAQGPAHGARAQGQGPLRSASTAAAARSRAAATILRESLRAALSVPASALYGGDEVCRTRAATATRRATTRSASGPWAARPSR